MTTDISELKGSAFVISDGLLHHSDNKTTHGLIRGSERFKILAVINPNHPGRDAGEVLDGKHQNIPLIETFSKAIELAGKPDFCIIGVATTGGMLPDKILKIVKEALSHGISVINGLHSYLGNIPEITKLAEKYNSEVIDIRKPKKIEELHFWSPEVLNLPCPVVAVLGMDCAIGKRTTAYFLMQACRKEGIHAEMIYSGQTGWMQGLKYGFILDSTLNDFVCGELSHSIINAYKNEQPDIIFLEGQSSLRNPSGPCGSEFLLAGNAKKVILVHRIKQEYFNDDITWGKLPSVESEIKLINAYGSEVIALMLNTAGSTSAEAEEAKENFKRILGIPVLLPVEEGVNEIIPILGKLVKETVINSPRTN